jgi:hypothetical protein
VSERDAPLRRNRDFNLLWTGQVVSDLGGRVSGIAFPLLVLALTGSPARAGIVGFAGSLPLLLLTLPAGAYVDRWDRKRVMVVADSVRCIALASIAVALALDALTFTQIVRDELEANGYEPRLHAPHAEDGLFEIRLQGNGFDLDDLKTLVRIGEDFGVGVKLDDEGWITLRGGA